LLKHCGLGQNNEFSFIFSSVLVQENLNKSVITLYNKGSDPITMSFNNFDLSEKYFLAFNQSKKKKNKTFLSFLSLYIPSRLFYALYSAFSVKQIGAPITGRRKKDKFLKNPSFSRSLLEGDHVRKTLKVHRRGSKCHDHSLFKKREKYYSPFITTALSKLGLVLSKSNVKFFKRLARSAFGSTYCSFKKIPRDFVYLNKKNSFENFIEKLLSKSTNTQSSNKADFLGAAIKNKIRKTSRMGENVHVYFDFEHDKSEFFLTGYHSQSVDGTPLFKLWGKGYDGLKKNKRDFYISGHWVGGLTVFIETNVNYWFYQPKTPVEKFVTKYILSNYASDNVVADFLNFNFNKVLTFEKGEYHTLLRFFKAEANTLRSKMWKRQADQQATQVKNSAECDGEPESKRENPVDAVQDGLRDQEKIIYFGPFKTMLNEKPSPVVGTIPQGVRNSEKPALEDKPTAEKVEKKIPSGKPEARTANKVTIFSKKIKYFGSIEKEVVDGKVVKYTMKKANGPTYSFLNDTDAVRKMLNFSLIGGKYYIDVDARTSCGKPFGSYSSGFCWMDAFAYNNRTIPKSLRVVPIVRISVLLKYGLGRGFLKHVKKVGNNMYHFDERIINMTFIDVDKNFLGMTSQNNHDFQDLNDLDVLVENYLNKMLEKNTVKSDNVTLNNILSRASNRINQWYDRAHDFGVRVRLSIKEKKILTDLFPELKIEFMDRTYSSHALFTAVRELSNYHFSKINNFGGFIDFGGNVLTHVSLVNHDVHVCNPIVDVRDSKRHVDLALRLQRVMIDNDNITLCTNKAQDCFYKSDRAIAVEVYDMSLRDMAKAMISHECKRLDFCLLLPGEILVDFTEIQLFNGSCVIKRENDFVNYFYGDSAESYTHDLKNLRSIMTDQIVFLDGKVFKKTLENSRGPFRYYSLVVCQCYPSGVHDFKTIYDFYEKQKLTVRVPVSNRCGMVEYHDVVIDKAFLINMIEYAANCVDNFNRKGFEYIMSHYRSRKSYTIYNGQVINEAVNLDINYLPGLLAVILAEGLRLSEKTNFLARFVYYQHYAPSIFKSIILGLNNLFIRLKLSCIDLVMKLTGKILGDWAVSAYRSSGSRINIITTSIEVTQKIFVRGEGDYVDVLNTSFKDLITRTDDFELELNGNKDTFNDVHDNLASCADLGGGDATVLNKFYTIFETTFNLLMSLRVVFSKGLMKVGVLALKLSEIIFFIITRNKIVMDFVVNNVFCVSFKNFVKNLKENFCVSALYNLLKHVLAFSKQKFLNFVMILYKNFRDLISILHESLLDLVGQVLFNDVDVGGFIAQLLEENYSVETPNDDALNEDVETLVEREPETEYETLSKPNDINQSLTSVLCVGGGGDDLYVVKVFKELLLVMPKAFGSNDDFLQFVVKTISFIRCFPNITRKFLKSSVKNFLDFLKTSFGIILSPLTVTLLPMLKYSFSFIIRKVGILKRYIPSFIPSYISSVTESYKFLRNHSLVQSKHLNTGLKFVDTPYNFLLETIVSSRIVCEVLFVDGCRLVNGFIRFYVRIKNDDGLQQSCFNFIIEVSTSILSSFILSIFFVRFPSKRLMFSPFYYFGLKTFCERYLNFKEPILPVVLTTLFTNNVQPTLPSVVLTTAASLTVKPKLLQYLGKDKDPNHLANNYIANHYLFSFTRMICNMFSDKYLLILIPIIFLLSDAKSSFLLCLTMIYFSCDTYKNFLNGIVLFKNLSIAMGENFSFCTPIGRLAKKVNELRNKKMKNDNITRKDKEVDYPTEETKSEEDTFVNEVIRKFNERGNQGDSTQPPEPTRVSSCEINEEMPRYTSCEDDVNRNYKSPIQSLYEKKKTSNVLMRVSDDVKQDSCSLLRFYPNKSEVEFLQVEDNILNSLIEFVYFENKTLLTNLRKIERVISLYNAGYKSQKDLSRFVNDRTIHMFEPIFGWTTLFSSKTEAINDVYNSATSDNVLIKHSPRESSVCFTTDDLAAGFSNKKLKAIEMRFAGCDFKNILDLNKIKVVNKPPGSGKTTTICDKMVQIIKRKSSVIALSITKVGRKEIISKLKTLGIHNASKICFTLDGALINNVDVNVAHIFIDECYMEHSGAIVAILSRSKFDVCELFGDVNQIPYICRIPFETSSLSQEIFKNCETEFDNGSFRCPLDVCYTLSNLVSNDGSRLYPNGVYSKKNKLVRTMDVCPINGPEDIQFSKDCQYICFTQNEKNELNRHFKITTVKTVNEIQGSTFEKVALVRTKIFANEIYNDVNQFVTAISRHTKDFRYYVPFSCLNDRVSSEISKNRNISDYVISQFGFRQCV
ncbi:polyprotein, partial [Cordyline virus 3]